MTSEPPAFALPPSPFGLRRDLAVALRATAGRASAGLAVASPRRPEPPGHPVQARLSVRNLQRGIPIDSGRLRAFLRIVAPAAGAPSGSATVALVTDGRMRALNRDFRGLDKPTDVLSFRTSPRGGFKGYLGDIVISVETAERQARRLRSTLPRELEILTLHGFLHLLGYDHETDDGEMRRIEYRLRRRLLVTRKSRALKNLGRALREPEPSARAKGERPAFARSASARSRRSPKGGGGSEKRWGWGPGALTKKRARTTKDGSAGRAR